VPKAEEDRIGGVEQRRYGMGEEARAGKRGDRNRSREVDVLQTNVAVPPTARKLCT
jgi:hypothetical protein